MKLRDGSLGWLGGRGHPGGAYVYVGNVCGGGGGAEHVRIREQCGLGLMGLTKLGVDKVCMHNTCMMIAGIASSLVGWACCG